MAGSVLPPQPLEQPLAVQEISEDILSQGELFRCKFLEECAWF